MSLPPGFLEEIRNRVSLAQVVGRKVTWDNRKSVPARGDYWAPCPFHQEKSASFHVRDDDGYYYCFGCHAKGDAISFLRETENMSFMEAVEALAREAGLSMPAQDPAAAARAEAARGLTEAMEAAVAFYRLQIRSARATEARDYLDRRGLTPATIERFEIGFAPDGRTVLHDHLKEKGFSRDVLERAGLIGVPKDGGSPYDRFRGRIMFPIRDRQSRAIAFGARALREGQEPKYLNSPATQLFDKSRSLYNIGPARAAARKADALVVCEGYMDVIALGQAGIDHAVAPLGTAITEEQLTLLWQMHGEPVVTLDGDRAGLAAAHRLADLALPLLQPGRALRFALMPDGSDPDDVVRTGGARAFTDLVEASRPMVNLIWARETEGQVLDSPERRSALDARLKAHLNRITDPGLKTHYQNAFRDLRQALFQTARPAPATKSAPRRSAWTPGRRSQVRAFDGPPLAATRASALARSDDPKAEARIRECVILTGCLNHPPIAADLEHQLEKLEFYAVDLAEIRDALLSCLHGALCDPDPATALGHAIGRRIGRNPLNSLTASGHVRANRYLSASADPALAKKAVDEALTQHMALSGRAAEIREAERELSGETDESLTWRLQQAAEAEHRSWTAPLADAGSTETEDESDLSARLQEMIDRQSWKKPHSS